MSAIWIVLAVLMLCEGLVTLRSVLRFRSFFFQQAMPAAVSEKWPKAAVLAPCKGLDPGLREHIESWLAQDYPDYAIFFIVESEDDPALEVIRQVNGSRILIAGKSVDCGQKIHNLRFAIDHLPDEYEAIVFVDSDAWVRPDWLKSLIGSLLRDPGDAATGYRWFDPGNSRFGDALRTAWNASVLTLYEPTGLRNFAWGGSTAILRKTFETVDVLRFWKGSLSDDYALTNAMRASQRRVHFVPRAMALSTDSVSLSAFLSWAGRQLLITRIYFPHLWGIAFAFHVLWMSWIALGLVTHPSWFAASFVAVQILQGIKASIRLQCARHVLPQTRSGALRFWLMSPFVGVVNFVLLSGNLISNRVRWRGAEYVLRGKNDLSRVR